MSGIDETQRAMNKYKVMGFGWNHHATVLSEAYFEAQIEILNKTFYHPKERNSRHFIKFDLDDALQMHLSPMLDEHLKGLRDEGSVNGWQLHYGVISGSLYEYFMRKVIDLPDEVFGDPESLKGAFLEAILFLADVPNP